MPEENLETKSENKWRTIAYICIIIILIIIIAIALMFINGKNVANS